MSLAVTHLLMWLGTFLEACWLESQMISVLVSDALNENIRKQQDTKVLSKEATFQLRLWMRKCQPGKRGRVRQQKERRCEGGKQLSVRKRSLAVKWSMPEAWPGGGGRPQLVTARPVVCARFLSAVGSHQRTLGKITEAAVWRQAGNGC